MKAWAWVIILVVVCLSAAGLVAIVFSSNKGDVMIVNQAAESIVQGKLEICHQMFLFSHLKPGESKEIFYKVWSDSHYEITIEFASGRKVKKRLGYVTSGVDFKDTLIVANDDIRLENRTFR